MQAGRTSGRLSVVYPHMRSSKTITNVSRFHRKTQNYSEILIVTEKDIINNVVAEELYPGDVKVGDIMSKDLFTVSKNEGIEEAAKLMRKKGVRRLVVLEDKRIVGIITETDIAKHLKAIVGGAPNKGDIERYF